MQPILGKPIAERLLDQVRGRIRSSGTVPGLAVILVGSNQASEIYVGLKERAAQSVGMRFEKHILPATTAAESIFELVRSLNARTDIHGIIVQLPLPAGMDTDQVIATIDPAKDADGFHPETVSRFLNDPASVPPVFPRAILALLESTRIPFNGKRALILANSSLFSRVMSTALSRHGIQSDSIIDFGSEALKSKLQAADIVVSAKGDPHFLRGDMVRPGVVVIDGGITRVGEEVKSDAEPRTFEGVDGYITPVPGGVGPVTVALLIARVAELATGERIEGSIL